VCGTGGSDLAGNRSGQRPLASLPSSFVARKAEVRQREFLSQPFQAEPSGNEPRALRPDCRCSPCLWCSALPGSGLRPFPASHSRVVCCGRPSASPGASPPPRGIRRAPALTRGSLPFRATRGAGELAAMRPSLRAVPNSPIPCQELVWCECQQVTGDASRCEAVRGEDEETLT
jgi:hypothetical protein